VPSSENPSGVNLTISRAGQEAAHGLPAVRDVLTELGPKVAQGVPLAATTAAGLSRAPGPAPGRLFEHGLELGPPLLPGLELGEQGR
jgi:hypothetical protein